MDKLSKPILEEDEEFKLPEADIKPDSIKEEENKDAEETKDDDSKKEEKEEKEETKELTDEELAERRAKIISVDAFNVDGDNIKGEENTEEKREEIIDIEAKQAEKEETKEEESEEDKTEEKEEVNSSKDVDPTSTKVKDAGKGTKDAEKVLNDSDKSEDIKKQTEKDIDKYKDLIKKAKKLSDVKESIVRLYPFSISLSDENFARFAALQPADKNKVYNYITEHAIFDVTAINEQWTTPLINEKRALKNWLKLASEEYKQLYVAAPQDVQDAIEESAKFVSINTQEDADQFWARTGLKRYDDRIMQRSLNEQYQIVETEELNETSEIARDLGYSVDYFKMLEDMVE